MFGLRFGRQSRLDNPSDSDSDCIGRGVHHCGRRAASEPRVSVLAWSAQEEGGHGGRSGEVVTAGREGKDAGSPERTPGPEEDVMDG